ncbi:hypothetical protein HHK36_006882 [Tetracentron sinense]|uniref:F-box domain-containing protein n=1 Tax=Tetracentron sinense TaxID=13715 RepID=A0A835DPM1_TETSI|nr:hypothetical protein HHK36_006882 [Tetracentron sinense]
MRLNPGLDIISNLPEHVIETILVHLPIRDAVRTSVLSHTWRYKWATTPELVFDDYSIPPPFFDENTILTSQDVIIHMHKLVNFIDRVLLVHKGPVHKFNLSTHFLNNSFIGAWILFLSRNGVKELTFKYRGEKYYRAPYSFFSCQAITCLNLLYCIFEPPSVFKGFSHLKSLNLRSVILSDEVLGPLTGLEKLATEGFFITFLAIGNLPARLPVSYDHLKSISLVINFEDLNETLVMLCLLQSSPNLHELEIVHDEADFTDLEEDFWEAPGHLDCSLNHLRVDVQTPMKDNRNLWGSFPTTITQAVRRSANALVSIILLHSSLLSRQVALAPIPTLRDGVSDFGEEEGGDSPPEVEVPVVAKLGPTRVLICSPRYKFCALQLQ